MLLACCFREQNIKKTKKKKKIKNNGKYEKIQESEDTSVKSRSLISKTKPITTHSPTIPADLKSNNFPQERHVPSGTEKCQIQRKSVPVDFLSNQGSTPSSTIDFQNVVLPTLLSGDVSRMFASAEDLDGSNLSVSNLQQTSMSSNPSLVSHSSQPASEVLITSTITNNRNSSSSSYKIEASSKNMNIIPKRNSIIENSKGNCRNTLLNDESFLLKQIGNDGQTAKNEDKENLLSKIREEYEKNIDNLKHQSRTDLENGKETFRQKLLEEKETHKKDLEKANTKAKNAANETICQLNKQIVIERAKMFAEHQENSKNLEEEFRMKEDRLNQSLNILNQSLNLIEEREQAWQDERADVHKEVQRLKAEATRMVQILAMEYEEDNLSEEKKRSLSQEVYSLQMVVEMRTREVRNLREQLAKGTQELEQAEVVKEKLVKATARIEDLEEQMKVKNRKERQLSVEKSQLEMNMTNTSKEVDRMSKNVESLQWRIRNNFDLPVDNLTQVTSAQQDQQRTSLPAFFADQEKNFKNSTSKRPQSTPMTEKKFQFSQTKKSLFMVSNEVIEATTSNIKVMKSEDSQARKSDLSPCSDGYNTSFTDDEHKVDKENKLEHNKHSFEYINNDDCGVDNLNRDVDVDEGVEDISSDYEHLNSPNFQKDQDTKMNKINTEVIIRTNSDRKEPDLSLTLHNSPSYNMQRLSSPTASPVKERIPSRFSFGK